MKLLAAQKFVDKYLDEQLFTWGIAPEYLEIVFAPLEDQKSKTVLGERHTSIVLDAQNLENESELAAYLERGLIYHLIATPMNRYRESMNSHFGISPDKEAVFINSINDALKKIERAVAGLRGTGGAPVAVIETKALSEASDRVTPLVGRPFKAAK